MSRFGESFRGTLDTTDSSPSSDPLFAAFTRFRRFTFKRKNLLILLVCYVGVYLFLRGTSLFDYERTMPLSAAESEMVCHTTNVTLQSDGIKPGLFLYDQSSKAVKIYLAATTVRRVMDCAYKNRHADDVNDDKRRRFTYTETYLNISGLDMQQMLDQHVKDHPLDQEFTVWYYGEGVENVCRHDRVVIDVNCISLAPLERIDDTLFYFSLVFALHSTCWLFVFAFSVCLYMYEILRSESKYGDSVV